MIRKVKKSDKNLFIKMIDEFYHSSGVLHSIPTKHYEKTFNEIMGNSPFATAYIIENNNETAGYGQISFTYSNEAGGLVVLIEEIYVRPQFRGMGLGTEFLNTMLDLYKDKASRFRLDIEPDNSGARKLYKSLGFKELNYESMVIECNL